MAKSKVPPDRLLLGMVSVVRTLVLELDRRGVLDQEEFVTILETTAAAHREAGDPNNLADAIHMLAEHMAVSITR